MRRWLVTKHPSERQCAPCCSANHAPRTRSLGRKGEIIMRIFVTGATGFIGSALVPELIQAGHSVLGLTRSEAGAAALRAAGAEVQHGGVEDRDSLRAGAANADGVIHLAFNHLAFNHDWKPTGPGLAADLDEMDYAQKV